MPPSVEEVPAPVNLAPRIVPELLAPVPHQGIKRLSTECESYEFSAALADPDPDDTLYWRVLIDYFADQTQGGLDPEELTQDIGPDPSGAASSRPLVFRVDPDDTRFTLASGVHVIELIAADRPFGNPEREFGLRRTTDDGLIDVATWVVTLATFIDPVCQTPDG